MLIIPRFYEGISNLFYERNLLVTCDEERLIFFYMRPHALTVFRKLEDKFIF